MAWLTVDKDGTENIFNNERKPFRIKELGKWTQSDWGYHSPQELARIKLPKGSIEKLIGRKLTWRHNPVKYD